MYIPAIIIPDAYTARGSVFCGLRTSWLIAETSSSPLNANAICDQKFTVSQFQTGNMLARVNCVTDPCFTHRIAAMPSSASSGKYVDTPPAFGKWLQNAGGVSTYLPLLALLGIAAILWVKHGSVTQFTRANMLPVWNWDTVNFWSQIAFAFSGLELVSAMSQEVRNPQKTLPQALYASGVLIAGMYIVATVAVLALVPAAEVSATSGVFHAITVGS